MPYEDELRLSCRLLLLHGLHFTLLTKSILKSVLRFVRHGNIWVGKQQLPDISQPKLEAFEALEGKAAAEQGLLVVLVVLRTNSRVVWFGYLNFRRTGKRKGRDKGGKLALNRNTLKKLPTFAR